MRMPPSSKQLDRMQSTKSVLPLYQRRVGGDIASKLNVLEKKHSLKNMK